MNEISTSFCFICLLHLANEKGLKLEGEDDDAEEDERKVGNIWDLKVCYSSTQSRLRADGVLQVYRDPTAAPSA